MKKIVENSDGTKTLIISGTRKISNSIFKRKDDLREHIEEITLPKSLRKILGQTFSGCKSLKKIEIPEGIKNIEIATFENCVSLEQINLPKSLEKIASYAFRNCSSLKTIEIPHGIEEIEIHTFWDCINLTEIKLPETLKKIAPYSFTGCRSLERIEIPSGIQEIFPEAFDGCDKLKEVKIFGITTYATIYFPNFYYAIKNKEELLKHSERIKYLLHQGIFLPQELIDERSLSDYLYNCEYKHMKNLLKMLPENCRDNNIVELYKLAKIMGILEKDSVTIRVNGKDVPVNNVAFTILQGAIKKGLIRLDYLHLNFQSLPNGQYSEEFLKFMANKTNLEELLSVNDNVPGFISSVYSWYEDRKKLDISDVANEHNNKPSEEDKRYKIRVYKETDTGIDKIKWNTPTVDLFIKEFSANKFSGMTDERSKEIAEYLSEFVLYQQKHYDKSIEIDNERINSNVKDHIIDTHIKEDIIESLEDYKKRAEEAESKALQELSNVAKVQTDTASKIFTYEMLAKSDVANFAMGFLTSCCATLYGAGAGAQRAMILHPDMQPLVIRNIQGKIIAFGILYVNRGEGYAVVNDFEVNVMYKNDYESRKEIYTKAMQGIGKFVKAYNEENKSKPIKIVTSGLSPNWDAINEFIKENPESEILKAPNFNDFKYNGSGSWSGDWHKKQHIIWDSQKEIRK